MNKLQIAKTRKVKTPERGTPESAGLDFFVPEFNERFISDFKKIDANLPGCIIIPEDNTIVIRPGARALIPSGIKYNLPKGYAILAVNKSGVATKQGLIVGACLGDSDYQGELHLSLINTNDTAVSITAGQKVIQFVVIPVELPEIELIATEEELYATKQSERGTGGFGSTGA